MKRAGYFTMMVLVSFFAGCESLDAGHSQDAEKKSLQQKRNQIISFINAHTCSTNTDCRYTPFGSKPCGGPWEYLLYPASVDTTRLFAMIRDYNTAESAYNKKWGIMSDCSVPSPPDSMACVAGKCMGYYFGLLKP
jgi:hypothetical protein